MITKNSHMNPVYGKEEVESVNEYINSGGWIMEHTKTRELESMICNFTGAKYAHMVTSATTGLLCASMVAKIQPGEKFAVHILRPLHVMVQYLWVVYQLLLM